MEYNGMKGNKSEEHFVILALCLLCVWHMIIYIYIWLQLRGSDFNIDGSKFKVQLG